MIDGVSVGNSLGAKNGEELDIMVGKLEGFPVKETVGLSVEMKVGLIVKLSIAKLTVGLSVMGLPVVGFAVLGLSVVGPAVGEALGLSEDEKEDGKRLGLGELGLALGEIEGFTVERFVGFFVGLQVGTLELDGMLVDSYDGIMLGVVDGTTLLGFKVGAIGGPVGVSEGLTVGLEVGLGVDGVREGSFDFVVWEGFELGVGEGSKVGIIEGIAVGAGERFEVGVREGFKVGRGEGIEVGTGVGLEVGMKEGFKVEGANEGFTDGGCAMRRIEGMLVRHEGIAIRKPFKITRERLGRAKNT